MSGSYGGLHELTQMHACEDAGGTEKINHEGLGKLFVAYSFANDDPVTKDEIVRIGGNPVPCMMRVPDKVHTGEITVTDAPAGRKYLFDPKMASQVAGNGTGWRKNILMMKYGDKKSFYVPDGTVTNTAYFGDYMEPSHSDHRNAIFFHKNIRGFTRFVGSLSLALDDPEISGRISDIERANLAMQFYTASKYFSQNGAPIRAKLSENFANRLLGKKNERPSRGRWEDIFQKHQKPDL